MFSTSTISFLSGKVLDLLILKSGKVEEGETGSDKFKLFKRVGILVNFEIDHL